MTKDYKITLKDGREIRLTKLFQFETYGICTYPNEMINQMTIKWNIECIERVFKCRDPYIITNTIKLDEKHEGILPYFTCAANFESYEPARDKNEDFSSMVIMWFQDHLATPIEDEIIKEIIKLNWNVLAEDGSY